MYGVSTVWSKVQTVGNETVSITSNWFSSIRELQPPFDKFPDNCLLVSLPAKTIPVFIFKSNNVEYARIVESPKNDLITDVAQIALGFPSKPNYEGANYLFKILDTEPLEMIEKNMNASWNYLKNLCWRIWMENPNDEIIHRVCWE